MGNKNSTSLTSEEVEEYAELTYLKKREIIRAFSRFRSIDPLTVDENSMTRLRYDLIRDNVAEIKCNPFGTRMLMLFSSEHDERLSFEDFLDMLSVFSRAAPITLKTSYAFRLYDFDGDSELGKEDLKRVLNYLAVQGDSVLSEEERETIVDKILEESDIARSGTINFQEFQHVVARCPEFTQSFSFELV
ncbi:calcium and integrin-binding protein 1-like [Amphibalanus amphitrite]|uniref:calcium and integrin-binding protein 1-like n=1 Tax=Amphibalanus amphitrite TaxID=1232801 RepID=UPI001C912C90|nr:calcium and integrin-binding protein 1-like [Amphibalanus amphitrite]XP_043195857.1 calcium and integrin-binding protein 1-like [Amphibalanus amphitrite]